MKPQLLPEKLEPLRSILIEPLLSKVIEFMFTPYKNLVFIYFLLSEDEIVYIGQTRNATRMVGRVYEHIDRDCQKFDRLLTFTTNPKKIYLTESALIKYFKPKYNNKHKDLLVNSSEVEILKILFGEYIIETAISKKIIELEPDNSSGTPIRIGTNLYKYSYHHNWYYYNFTINNEKYAGTLSPHLTLDEAQEIVDKKKKNIKGRLVRFGFRCNIAH